jgi:hypothetical protein
MLDAGCWMLDAGKFNGFQLQAASFPLTASGF